MTRKHQPTGMGQRLYLNENVFDAAKERIRWLFDEYETIVVSVSGGKDSTVVAELTIEVARELGRLPQPLLWLDQEAEWQATVDNVRQLMYRPEVDPYWMQIPFKMFNATSSHEHWLRCWDPARKDDWVHPQDPISKKENIYPTDRFGRLLSAIVRHHWPGEHPKDQNACSIGGVRCEESPGRALGLTQGGPTHKWATWGFGGPPSWVPGFYPIYDWTMTDVWHAIHENEWVYCDIYNQMHRYGVPPRGMRVSHLHHEMAVTDLFILQEIEPETYVRLENRIEGIDMAAKFAHDYAPKELPDAFNDWHEYRDYLLEHLVEEPYRSHLAHKFREHDIKMTQETMDAQGYRTHVKSILLNDWEGDALSKWTTQIAIARELRERRPLWEGSKAHEAWREEGRMLPPVDQPKLKEAEEVVAEQPVPA